MIRLLKGYESSLSWPVYMNYVTPFYIYTQSLAVTTSQSYTGDTMASLTNLNGILLMNPLQKNMKIQVSVS